MRNKVLICFLYTALCFFSSDLFGQSISPPPPDDTYMSHETDGCGDTLEDPDPSDPVVPPGLCMPINDYLIPLLFAGIILGIYKIHRIETAK